MGWESPTNSTPLYIATITPKIARFTDKLQYNAVLLGPGLPSIDITALSNDGTLPPGLDAEAFPSDTKVAGSSGTNQQQGMVLTPPSTYEDCSFVDTNPVMQMFSDPITDDGTTRCMEQLKLEVDYKDKLCAGKTWESYWLYSKELEHKSTGKYYLVSWLSERNSGAVVNSNKLVNGKYEITMGPHTWSGYADQDTKDEAYVQETTCSCDGVVIAYLEQFTERIGYPDVNAFAEALPQYKCSAGTHTAAAPSSYCSAMHTYEADKEYFEWAGEFALQTGTYSWNFHAFGTEWKYPDRTMNIVAAKCGDLDGVLPTGNITALTSVEESAHSHVHDYEDAADRVAHTEKIKWDKEKMQQLQFEKDWRGQVSENTTDYTTQFMLEVTDAGKYCIFTEHVPAEFLATYLRKEDAVKTYHYPTYARLYSVGSGPSGQPGGHGHAHGPGGHGHAHGDGTTDANAPVNGGIRCGPYLLMMALMLRDVAL